MTRCLFVDELFFWFLSQEQEVEVEEEELE